MPNKICLIVNEFDVNIVPNELKNNPLIEIIYSEYDIKGHNKYYHTMLKYTNAVIITIDDDVIYPNTFIEDCIKAYEEFPDCINACRVHKIRYKNNKLLPYRLWEWETKDIGPSYDLFFTGVGGVVYPPNVFNKEDLNLERINDYKRVDDILLNWLCRKHNVKIRRVETQNNYIDINIVQNKAKLCTFNVLHNNDVYLNKINFK